MADEYKRLAIEELRDGFMVFMRMVMKMPAAPMQKQQAFLRFDEGHMWMQNAIMNFVQPPETAANSEQAEGSHAIAQNGNEVQPAEELQ